MAERYRLPVRGGFAELDLIDKLRLLRTSYQTRQTCSDMFRQLMERREEALCI